jgi:hypothetical protein
MWELTAIIGGFVLISAGVIVLARRSTAQWERETRLARRRRRRGGEQLPSGGVAGARPMAAPVRAGAARTVAGRVAAGRVAAGRVLAGRVLAGRARRHAEAKPARVRRIGRRPHRTRSSDEPADPVS